MAMSSLAQITPAQFQQLREERFNRVTALLNLDISWDNLFTKQAQQLFNQRAYTAVFKGSIHDVYDETNQCIGEDWMWGWQKYYFVRDQDRLWFIMRWHS